MRTTKQRNNFPKKKTFFAENFPEKKHVFNQFLSENCIWSKLFAKCYLQYCAEMSNFALK